MKDRINSRKLKKISSLSHKLFLPETSCPWSTLCVGTVKHAASQGRNIAGPPRHSNDSAKFGCPPSFKVPIIKAVGFPELRQS
mmetsp:Transcript_34774/g.108857  ORF Transcript_34774/g.108857 Transcript_34774/m.108857 type:complete len:83 (-) Transcript_34774:140-388(-)